MNFHDNSLRGSVCGPLDADGSDGAIAAPNTRRRLASIASVLLPFCLAQTSAAQGKPRQIGCLSPFPQADVEYLLRSMRAELEKFGWIDGRNIEFLPPRLTEGTSERLPALAAELVSRAPDVILVQSAPATRAAMQATRSIPILMVGVGNPVEYGIVPELGKPGGNVTGVAFLADESIRKLMQLLKVAVPGLRSVALFANPTNEAAAPMIRMVRADAAAAGIRAQVVEVRESADFEPAFAAIRREGTESILLPPEPLIRTRREAIGEFAQAHGLVLAIVGQARYLPRGGLIGYAPALAQFAQIAALYVDKILKGAKAGDLPVQQPSRFELVVNLKTARALGLTLPPSFLAGADEIVQ